MGTTASPILTGSGLATFNGTSTYAGSLQNEISRAVSIASIPLDQLETNVSDLQGQTGELSTLQTDFTSILTSLQNLDSSSGGNSLAASTSDSTVATATINSAEAVSSGTYTVTIKSPGSPETTLSNSTLPTVTDPASTSISTSSSYTLTVGTSTFTINPSSNNLNALAQAINGANAGVSATVLNLGSPSSPNYQLSLQSTSLGNVAIQLNDGAQDLLSTLTTGTPATYQINGLPSTPISSNSSTVTIAPGVNVNLLQAGQTTVTVAPDPTAAESALSGFVTAYNTAQTELNNNHGANGGALTGQSIVDQLSQSLSSIINYSGGSGSITSLTQLGVTFSSSGQLQFDQGTYESAIAANPTDVANFLGSASGGTGFLGTASNLLNGLTDSSKGLFATTDSTYTAQINSDNTQISADTQRIETMQNDMVAQMSQADALIASMQNQVSYYTTLFQDTQNAITNGG